MTVRADIPPSRRAEYAALVALLIANAALDDAETRAVAGHIARASLEDGHLWRAMGLPDRGALRDIMRTRFRPLFDANSEDMRWKRFLYKRMCGWSGFDA